MASPGRPIRHARFTKVSAASGANPKARCRRGDCGAGHADAPSGPRSVKSRLQALVAPVLADLLSRWQGRRQGRRGAWRGVVTITVGMGLEQSRPGPVIPAREADNLIEHGSLRGGASLRRHRSSLQIRGVRMPAQPMLPRPAVDSRDAEARMTPPRWVDEDGRLCPTRPCPTCGRVIPIKRVHPASAQVQQWRRLERGDVGGVVRASAGGRAGSRGGRVVFGDPGAGGGAVGDSGLG